MIKLSTVNVVEEEPSIMIYVELLVVKLFVKWLAVFSNVVRNLIRYGEDKDHLFIIVLK